MKHEAIQPSTGFSNNLAESVGKRNLLGSLYRRLSWVPGFKHRRFGPDNGPSPDSPDSSVAEVTPTEILSSDAHIITDVLPHKFGDPNPVKRKHIQEIMSWADDQRVKGHIFRLETTPRDPYISRWEAFLLYYHGAINDEGEGTDPSDSTFFMAQHGLGENAQLLAVTTMRWKGVHFENRGRTVWVPDKTAYWEREIVKPELQGVGIGLAFGIECLDFAFFKSKAYNGQPADAIMFSTYVDRDAIYYKGDKSYSHWARNEEYFKLLGAKHNGSLKPSPDGRSVQPWILTLRDYVPQRPKAIEHLQAKQPERARYLEKQWPRLLRQFQLRAQTLPQESA